MSSAEASSVPAEASSVPAEASSVPAEAPSVPSCGAADGPPKTLVVTGHFPPAGGGVQTFTWEFVRRLPPDRVVVVAPHQPGAAAFDRTLPFPVIRRRWYLLFRGLRRIAREHGCTAGWITAAAPFGLYAPMLRRAGLSPVVVSSHGQELGWLRAWPTRLALRAASRSFDTLTVLSGYTGERLARGLRRPEIMRQLAGGVDVDVFRPGAGGDRLRAELGLGEQPLVVSCARLVRRKGHDLLLEAWPTVLDAVPDAHLVIIGTGVMRERLERRAAAADQRGSVRLTGFVPNEDLAAYLDAAQAFVLACRDDRRGLQTEGLGLSVLEASATGVPVVVGRSGGSPDSLLDGRTGYLVDSTDPADVARGLIALLRDPAGSREMGAAGHRWVCERWSWEAAAERLVRLLRGCPPAPDQRPTRAPAPTTAAEGVR